MAYAISLETGIDFPSITYLGFPMSKVIGRTAAGFTL
jgi:hypothetical protein